MINKVIQRDYPNKSLTIEQDDRTSNENEAFNGWCFYEAAETLDYFFVYIPRQQSQSFHVSSNKMENLLPFVPQPCFFYVVTYSEFTRIVDSFDILS